MTEEQYAESVAALKRATKATKPYYWWFCPKDAEGEASLLVGKKLAVVQKDGKSARKDAQDKRFAFGRVMPKPDGALGFGLDEGSARPKQIQRLFVAELCKAEGFKRIKGLLMRAEILDGDAFTTLFGNSLAAESASKEGPDVKAMQRTLAATRERAKEAFIAARERGISSEEQGGLQKTRQEADEKGKGALAPTATAADVQEAIDAFEALAEEADAVGTAGDLAGGAAREMTADINRLNQAWLDAFNTVRGQRDALATHLRTTGDEELQVIADQGLANLAEGKRVEFQAAMQGAVQAVPENRAEAYALVAELADDFADWLSTSREVEAVDGNPFGVPVSFNTTLGTALRTIAAAL